VVRTSWIADSAAKLAAEEAEKSRAAEAALQARVEARIAAYRQQLPGDDAAFERAWSRLLEDWQIEQARQQREAMLNEVRARVGRL
jgi:hypothetical protein